MIKIDGEDWELPQMGKSPKIGYNYQYITKESINGKIHRVYLGKRFYANITYAFLTDEQVTKLMSSIGLKNVEIDTPIDTFKGLAIIEISSMPTKFDSETWTGWGISITGRELIK